MARCALKTFSKALSAWSIGCTVSFSLLAFEDKEPSCDPALKALSANQANNQSEDSKLARRQLQQSYFFHGTPYESARPDTAEKLLSVFPPAISFSNEHEIWDLIRDRALLASFEHPDRYVVSTGLQQSLELLFAGIPKVIMADAYGPNIAAFAFLNERAKQNSDAESFFLDVEDKLQILKSTGEGPSSWFGSSNTVGDFLKTLKSYGEIGYQKFRSAALRGSSKAYLQDMSDPRWGKIVREMSDGKAPSFIYASNIINWIKSNHGDHYTRNLQTLSVDFEDKPSWFRFSDRKYIEFGSLIAQTTVNYTGFSHEIAQLWDLRVGPTIILDNEWAHRGFKSSAKVPARQSNTKDLKALDRSYIRLISQLTNQPAYEGLLKLHDNIVMINTLNGWDIEVAYDPRLHRIEAATPTQPSLDILHRKGKKLRIKSSKDKAVMDITLVRPQKITPDGKGFISRWKAINQEGKSMDFTFDPKIHEIIETVDLPHQ